MGILAREEVEDPRLERQATEDGFVEVVGERIALLGEESGVFECWMWPLKLFHDLRLVVRTVDGGEPRFGRTVTVTPGELFLDHRDQDLHLRQEIFACRERRGLVCCFTLERGEELELELSLRCDLVPMWPAGLGGRLARVDPDVDALCLTEELGRFAALIGAEGADVDLPEAVHALPGGPVRIRFPLSEGERRAFVIAGAQRAPEPLSPNALRGGEQSATGFARARRVIDEARELWSELSAGWEDERESVREHWRRVVDRGARVHVAGQGAVERAYLWSRIAIERAWVRVDGLGRGLVAGLAPSGDGERPGYGWFFDGDAMAAARALTLTGDFDEVREILRFAASHQRDDGKLMHELTLSAGLCDWLGDYPYAYYKGVNTPDFVACLAYFVSFSGDLELARELWPNAVAAIRWCAGCVDEAGRITNTRAGIAAVEAGPLSDRIESEIFLQGAYLSGLAGAIALAEALGEDDEPFRSLLERASAGLETFWSDERGRYGFAHLRDGSRCDDLSAYVAQPLAHGFGRPQRTWATVQALDRPEVASDWGVRMFATDSPVYDPAHYNTGAVFPYLTNFVTLAQFAHAHPIAGHQLFFSQVGLCHLGGLGLIEEHFEGDRARIPLRGVPHQVFSSSAIVESLLAGLLGIRGDASHERLVLRPSLPVGWSQVSVDDLRVGATRLGLSLVRASEGGRTVLRLTARRRAGPRLRVDFAPVLPPLTEVEGHDVQERPSGAIVPRIPEQLLEDELVLEVRALAGPSVELPATIPPPGGRSRSPRLVAQQMEEDSLVWTFAGRAGTEVTLRLACDRPVEVEGAMLTELGLRLAFPEESGNGWTTMRVRIEVR